MCTEKNHELLPEKRYIHKVRSQDGVDMIITMLPSLAALIHTADSTLHDNTYKRVYGKWKEWEVVIWDKRLNMSKFVLFTTGHTRSSHSDFCLRGHCSAHLLHS